DDERLLGASCAIALERIERQLLIAVPCSREPPIGKHTGAHVANVEAGPEVTAAMSKVGPRHMDAPAVLDRSQPPGTSELRLGALALHGLETFVPCQRRPDSAGPPRRRHDDPEADDQPDSYD